MGRYLLIVLALFLGTLNVQAATYCGAAWNAVEASLWGNEANYNAINALQKRLAGDTCNTDNWLARNAALNARDFAKLAYIEARDAYKRYGWTYSGYYARNYAFRAWQAAHKTAQELTLVALGRSQSASGNNYGVWANFFGILGVYWNSMASEDCWM